MTAGTEVGGKLLTPYAIAHPTFTEPGTADWFDVRRSGVGGSNVAAIMGEDPYQDSFQLYLEKKGDPYVRATEAAQPFSESIHFGHLLEPLVVAETARRITAATGQAFRIGTLPLLQDTRCPYRLANLDAVLYDADAGPDAMPEALVEAKTTGLQNLAAWREGVPTRALLQTHYYLLVTGLPVAYVCCLVAGQRLFWHEVRPDEGMAEAISTAVAEFWQRVTAGEPPLPTGAASTTQLLRDMHPVAVKGSTVDLSAPEDAQLVTMYRLMHTLEKATEKCLGKLANRLRLRLGDAEAGTVDGRVVVRYPTVNGSRFDMVAFKEADPALVERYTVPNPYRVLKVKP